MISKEEMSKKDMCHWFDCNKCPFYNEYTGYYHRENISAFECLRRNKSQYAKDKDFEAEIEYNKKCRENNEKLIESALDSYKKPDEKELNMEDKELDLVDLGNAIVGDLKICHYSWHDGHYIVVNSKKAGWIDSDGAELAPSFAPISDWRYYKEPAKTEKRTFYMGFSYDREKDCFYNSPWVGSKKSSTYPDGKEQFDSWEEKEFNVPIKEE
jgi:hypothetical protein